MVGSKSLFFTASFLFFLFSSCGKSIPELKGINQEEWKQDRGGCSGIRTQMLDTIQSQKNNLLRLNELDIVNLLGKPDENELLKRNQKIYRFFLTPSASCANHENEPVKLVIRFNAMGLAKEVSIE
jgi:hypothetical protein